MNGNLKRANLMHCYMDSHCRKNDSIPGARTQYYWCSSVVWKTDDSSFKLKFNCLQFYPTPPSSLPPPFVSFPLCPLGALRLLSPVLLSSIIATFIHFTGEWQKMDSWTWFVTARIPCHGIRAKAPDWSFLWWPMFIGVAHLSLYVAFRTYGI